MSEHPDSPLEQKTLQLWTSNSFRRFRFADGSPACEPITQASDGHPDLCFPGGFEGPIARRMLATWNACKGISTAHLDAIQKPPRSLAAIFHDYLNGADEREELSQALRRCAAATDPAKMETAAWEAIATLRKYGRSFTP